jgi:hypothetical protein
MTTLFMPLRRALVLALAGLLAGAALAGPKEAAQSAAKTASGVAVKVEGAVKRGAKAAAGGVERGAHAAGRVVKKGARKIGLPAASASAPARSRPHGG